jgi:ABC-2 type transport system permease protein
MSTPANTVPGPPLESQVTAPAVITASRRLYWAVRRELWEHRSIYIAPLAAAAVVLLAFLTALTVSPAHRREPLDVPYEFAAALIMGTAFIVGIFYSLDALYGERRDRSILFWKSLPVSDLVTVLSKAVVPLVMLPVIACAVIVTLQIVILIVASVILQASGLDVAALWSGASVFHMWGGVIYDVIGLALWHAPLYAWLLLVSGWAPRATFLWAVLPPLALCLIEHIAFGTKFLVSLLKYRLFGFEEFGYDGHHHDVADPIALLSSSGLWSGLLVAALLLATAVWLRRYRQPI